MKEYWCAGRHMLTGEEMEVHISAYDDNNLEDIFYASYPNYELIVYELA